MKQRGFRIFGLAVALILAGVVVFQAVGDDVVVAYETVIVDTFDDLGKTHEWNTVAAHPFTWTSNWSVEGSKYRTVVKDAGGAVTDEYPQLKYIPTYPQALFGTVSEESGLKSLGIVGSFDRKGYNWIDVYPVNDQGAPRDIPLPGRVSFFDLWVWGSNLNYTIEAYVRDYQGVIHSFNMGSIAYTGWRNLRAKVPSNISQAKRVLPSLANLSFVKFRIWTSPREQVGKFYVYFDQFKIMTDNFESLFDGKDLADPVKVDQLWNGQ